MIHIPQFDTAQINSETYRYGDRVMITIEGGKPFRATITGLECELVRFREYRRRIHKSVRFNNMEAIQHGWST